MNSSVAGTARAASCVSPTSPTMMPRYAGTSGMMHGARNDATPAPNNATTCVSVLPTRSPEREVVRLETRRLGDEPHLMRLHVGSLDHVVHVGVRHAHNRLAVGVDVHVGAAQIDRH